MKRVVVAVAVIGLLVGIGVGGWFGVASLNEENDSFPRRSAPALSASPTPLPVAVSCDKEVLCGLWLMGTVGQEAPFAPMARACGLPADPKWSGYFFICRPSPTSQGGNQGGVLESPFGSPWGR